MSDFLTIYLWEIVLLSIDSWTPLKLKYKCIESLLNAVKQKLENLKIHDTNYIKLFIEFELELQNYYNQLYDELYYNMEPKFLATWDVPQMTIETQCPKFFRFVASSAALFENEIKGFETNFYK
jgi:hypothetical protein